MNACGPQVAVSIACRGCRLHIRRAVETLLRQTHQNLIVIVINNGDPEPPWDLLADLMDTRLIFFDLYRSAGPDYAHAVSLGASCAEYFLVSGADDWSEPRRVERLLGKLVNERSVAAFSSARQWNAQGTYSPVTGHPRAWAPSVPQQCRPLATPYGLFLSSVLKRMGGSMGAFHFGYNTLLSNVLPLLGAISYVEEPLYNCLSHAASRSPGSQTTPGSRSARSAQRNRIRRCERIYAVCQASGARTSALPERLRKVLYESIPITCRRALLHDQRRLAAVLALRDSQARILGMGGVKGGGF